jgi:hypothetical protein
MTTDIEIGDEIGKQYLNDEFFFSANVFNKCDRAADSMRICVITQLKCQKKRNRNNHLG